MDQLKRERHPIADAPCDQDGAPWPLTRRVHYLECQLARLWDEVWWHQLPFWRRWWYMLPRVQWDRTARRLLWWPGHRSPIREFYLPWPR